MFPKGRVLEAMKVVGNDPTSIKLFRYISKEIPGLPSLKAVKLTINIICGTEQVCKLSY